MNSCLIKYSVAGALIAFSALGAGYAQTYKLSWFTLHSGGGPSTNGFFGLSATIGQTDAGTMSNTNYQIEGGFWAAARRTRPFIYASPLGITNANTNQTVTFTNRLVGTPPFQFQWLLNGVILPGETNEILTITNAQWTQGGAYTCVGVNEFGAVISEPAPLEFALEPLPPPPPPNGPPSNDHFINRVGIALTNQVFKASNAGATIETNEPPHAHKLGGASVWYTWSINSTGIATFRTEGSAFDTLLAVYTNNTLETLSLVASDDDAAAFLTSEVRFNVTAATEYQIAIDGLGARQGSFIVTWDFKETTARLPLISCQPKSQSVLPGSNATFDVVVAPQVGLHHQWFFRGNPILDATNATLTISNCSPPDLGFYSVAVTNDAGLGAVSRRAALEFGPHPTVVSYAKIEDLFADSGLLGFSPPACAFAPSGVAQAALSDSSSGFASVSFGSDTVNNQEFYNTDTNISQCENCSDTLGRSAKYYGLKVLESGILEIDTSGSTNSQGGSLDTILIVYEYKASNVYDRNVRTTNECQFEIACDDNSGTGKTSRLRIPAIAGRYYVAEVDGKNGDTGNVKLNWNLSPTPAPFENAGGDLYLTAPTNFSLFFIITNYYWFKNNEPIGTSSEPRLLLEASLVQTAGTYAVGIFVEHASANSWSVERLNHRLGSILATEFRLSSDRSTFQLVLPGLTNTDYRVEAASSTNSAAVWQWTAVTPSKTNQEGTSQILSFPVNQAGRFFRVRPE